MRGSQQAPEVSIERKFSEARERIHRKAHAYFTFSRLPVASRNQFFGATDALLDTSIQASHFGDGVKAAPQSRLLLAYGFLQALFVQQDAVETMSRSLGQSWHPTNDPQLERIREIRNRLLHPAEAGRKGKKRGRSSAIINATDIHETKFLGHIYYESGFETVTVEIAKFLQTNLEKLLPQMEIVERAMDESERAFRETQARDPFTRFFDDGFRYLVQRLNCTLRDADRRHQAESHARMLRERFANLQSDLLSRGFTRLSEWDGFRIIDKGLERATSICLSEDESREQQDEFDLLYAGIEKYITELGKFVRELDEELAKHLVAGLR